MQAKLNNGIIVRPKTTSQVTLAGIGSDADHIDLDISVGPANSWCVFMKLPDGRQKELRIDQFGEVKEEVY